MRSFIERGGCASPAGEPTDLGLARRLERNEFLVEPEDSLGPLNAAGSQLGRQSRIFTIQANVRSPNV